MLTSVVHAGSPVRAVGSPGLMTRLKRFVASVESCRVPRDLIAYDRSRLLVYEAGVFPRHEADQWLGTFCTLPNLPPLVICWNQGTDALRESARLLAVTNGELANIDLNLRQVILRRLAGQRSTEIVALMLERAEIARARPCDHVLLAALALGDARRAVTDLAQVTGTGVRALSQHCRSAGLPRPVTLLGWSRALHIVAAMDWDSESLRDVVVRTGETTTRDCADYVRYHTGRAPGSWMRAGGVDALVEAFVRRVRSAGTADAVSPLFVVPTLPAERADGSGRARHGSPAPRGTAEFRSRTPKFRDDDADRVVSS